MYFVVGDRERLDRVRGSQADLTHPDERFLLNAPTPTYEGHISLTAGPNVNSVCSGVTEHNGRSPSLALIDHGFAFARPGDFHTLTQPPASSSGSDPAPIAMAPSR
jgi:hypothetical protein